MYKFDTDAVFTITRQVADVDSLRVEVLKPRDFSEPCLIKIDYNLLAEKEERDLQK